MSLSDACSNSKRIPIPLTQSCLDSCACFPPTACPVRSSCLINPQPCKRKPISNETLTAHHSPAPRTPPAPVPPGLEAMRSFCRGTARHLCGCDPSPEFKRSQNQCNAIGLEVVGIRNFPMCMSSPTTLQSPRWTAGGGQECVEQGIFPFLTWAKKHP